MPGSQGQNLQHNCNTDKQKNHNLEHLLYILTRIDHVLDMFWDLSQDRQLSGLRSSIGSILASEILFRMSKT